MKTIITALLTMSLQFAFAQIDFTPYPGDVTHCPGELKTYTSSVTGSSCGIRTWTITNGKIIDPANNNEVTTLSGTEVTIRWDDVAGTGKLKVTVTCGTETHIQEKNFAIRSLKGRIPANARKNRSLPYCSTLDVTLAVDVMFLENTGGTTGVTQQRADGYEWVLPTGWKSNGSPGTVTTSSELINIYPDDGCKGGTVTVKAFMDCNSGRKYSAPASIDVNRLNPSLTITPQAGYSGPRCGQVQAVTFTVTPISCATNYTWVFPIGWAPGPFVAGNSVTLTPSGDESDAGEIQVTANLSCTSIASTPYTLRFNYPVLTGSNLICNSASFALQNAGTGSVTWSSSNTSIATVSSSGVVTRVSNANGEVTITAAFSCPVPAVTKTTWIGSPIINVPGSDPGDPGDPGPGPNQFCQTYYYETQNKVELTGGGFISTVQYEWDIASDNFGYYTQGNTIHIQPHTLGTIAFGGRASNACGWSRWAFFMYEVVDCNNPNPQSQYSIYPNPTSETLTIENSSLTQNSAFINDQETNANATVLTPPAYKLYNYKQKAVLSGVVYEHQTLDVSALKKGKYMLVITTGENTETHQIVLK